MRRPPRNLGDSCRRGVGSASARGTCSRRAPRAWGITATRRRPCPPTLGGKRSRRSSARRRARARGSARRRAGVAKTAWIARGSIRTTTAAAATIASATGAEAATTRAIARGPKTPTRGRRHRPPATRSSRRRRGWRRKPPRWRASPRDARRQRAVTAREGPSAIAGEGVGEGTGEETRGEETAAAAAEAIASDASDGEDPKNALVALRLLESAPTLRFFSHPYRYPAI